MEHLTMQYNFRNNNYLLLNSRESEKKKKKAIENIVFLFSVDLVFE